MATAQAIPGRTPSPAAKIRDAFGTLANLPIPRPFVWYKFVSQRRVTYSMGSMIVLALFIFLLFYCLGQVGSRMGSAEMRPYWIAVFFGALVVVALTRYTYMLSQLWDTSKSLSRYGRLGEANVLWVVASPQRLVLAYRFWTSDDVEIVKETVIDADGPFPLAQLAAGDIVPVLYDPRRARQRSMIWTEIERYMALRQKKDSAPKTA